MRPFYYDILVDGQPILVPDADITAEYTDLDSEESGRDESGVMHRIVARRGVLKMRTSAMRKKSARRPAITF